MKNVAKDDFVVEAAGEGIYCRSAAAAVKLLKEAERWWQEHTPAVSEIKAEFIEIPEQVSKEPEKRWGFFRLIQGGKGRKEK